MPEEGACDWGLNQYYDKTYSMDPTCEICMQYYDGRTGEKNPNLQGNDCVWVPSEGMCYPKNHAANSMESDYYESCEGLIF